MYNKGQRYLGMECRRNIKKSKNIKLKVKVRKIFLINNIEIYLKQKFRVYCLQIRYYMFCVCSFLNISSNERMIYNFLIKNKFVKLCIFFYKWINKFVFQKIDKDD